LKGFVRKAVCLSWNGGFEEAINLLRKAKSDEKIKDVSL
jgi:hypothetical protein